MLLRAELSLEVCSGGHRGLICQGEKKLYEDLNLWSILNVCLTY